METELVHKSRSYAQQVFQNLPATFSYHNLQHTTEVVAAAETIGIDAGLSQEQKEILLIAAWLHDTGYANNPRNHETAAMEEAERLLNSWNASTHIIAGVKAAIEATQMPQQPKDRISEILCDADLHHLASENIDDISERLRKEWELTLNKTYSDDQWIQLNINFFKQHQYFTSYGRTILQERKERNIKKLKKKLKKDIDKDYVKSLEKDLEKLQRKMDKKSNPERGVETMFRIASENHITLSGMADTKANIMISINSIILSVVVTVLFRKLEEFPNLLIPTLMLVLVCLITIVFAVLATRPNVSTGKFTKEDIEQKRTNLLFFGNFHGMELANFDWGMREMMKDADYLYGSLIKDIYFNGKVLARKYRLLRISYSIFMFGFCASIIAFIVALLIYYYPTDNLPI